MFDEEKGRYYHYIGPQSFNFLMQRFKVRGGDHLDAALFCGQLLWKLIGIPVDVFTGFRCHDGTDIESSIRIQRFENLQSHAPIGELDGFN